MFFLIDVQIYIVVLCCFVFTDQRICFIFNTRADLDLDHGLNGKDVDAPAPLAAPAKDAGMGRSGLGIPRVADEDLSTMNG